MNGSRAELVFELAEPAGRRVEINLFDVSGRRVAPLFGGRVEAGYRRIEWRARDVGARLAAGLYFARVDDGMAAAIARVALAE